MNVFQVTAEVAALSECFLALGTGKRSLASVLTEVVPQITALLKDRATTLMTTLKVELHTHRLVVPYFDCLVPVARDALECLRFGA